MYSAYLFTFMLVSLLLGVPRESTGVQARTPSPKEDEFAEFDDNEFDYGVNDEGVAYCSQSSCCFIRWVKLVLVKLAMNLHKDKNREK